MQRYRWPGYDIQLLGELQRQQNNAQFCDTLLQTEGISVPTHSCILAALSPYLSQKLSASPSPPSGQKRQLQLQAVKAQTLLKLVGLLYSGEVELKGGIEQDDVLSAARQFGITDLVEGWRDGGIKEGEPQKRSFGSCRERNESRKMQDAQVQAEVAGRGATDRPVEKRSCVSTGTQTVKGGEKTAGSYFTQSGQTKPPTWELTPPVAQSLDFSITLQPQDITHFNSTCLPPIPRVPSRVPSNGESTFDQPSDSVTNPTSTSAWPSNVMTCLIPSNDDSSSLTPQEDGSYQQSPESGDRIGAGLADKITTAKMAVRRENTELPSHGSTDEILGEEKGNSAEKKHAHANVSMKSMAKMKQMQQMIETTQISIKVKLRRRTKGEVWEVVSMQDANETLAVLTSLKQMDLTNIAPSSVQAGPVHNPETRTVQPATPNSPISPAPHPNTTSDSQLLCSDCFTPNQNHELESVPLAQPPGTVEESDEQIERLLEDIMMSLNILPNLERDCKKSHHVQPSRDGSPSVCHVPVAENEPVQSQMHAAVSAAGCVCYQDFGTQIGHSSTDTGVHCCSTAQNQPSCSSLPSVQPDAVLIQQQQQQRSPQYHSSVTSMGQKAGTSHQGTTLSKSQNCPYPEAITTRAALPSTFFSSWQKLHYSACQAPASQDDQNILEFLPLTNENEAQSSHPFSLPCMDDLRLPRCLSPLEPFASATKHQPILNNSANHGDNIQPQLSLHGPWLTENPASLQFPLSAITHREDAFLPQDTNQYCWSKQWQKHLEMNSPQSRGTRAESCTVEKGGTVSAGHRNAAEVKSDHRKVKKNFRCKPGDTEGDAAAPKRRIRKRTSHPQKTAGSLLAHKDVEDGRKSHISLSSCSVRLSSNNVLAKEREMAASFSNVPNRFLGKPDEPSAIAESWMEKTGEAGDLSTDPARIRTRGFLKKTQETPSNTSLENSPVLKPMAHRARIVNKPGDLTPKRKRGRPSRTKLKESPSAIRENKSHGVESEQQMDNTLPKEEGGEKTKRRCKKRRRDRSEVEVIPLKKTISAGQAEAADNNDIIPAVRSLGTPKWPRMVTLKEFQKLIKRQHSKTRKSKQSHSMETNETARDEEKTCELIQETELDMDVTQPRNKDVIEGSHILLDVTVDKNHNHIFNKSRAEYSKSQRGDNSGSSARQETSLFGDECRLVLSHDVLGEEAAMLAADREQPLHNYDEACDAGVSDTTQQTVISDDSSAHSDTHTPPQEHKRPSYHDLNPQTPERTSPPLSDVVGFIKSSGGDEEEEEEELEVDVLLFSPDKVPQSRDCENGLGVTPEEEEEEEEEEDVNVTDVTGDEAE